MKLNQKIYDIKMAFLEACKKYQNNIALKLEDKVISYKDLYLKAVSLIYAIEKQHNNCSMVGIMSQRNEAAFISVAASVIAQKTYVPLNPRFPDNRLKSMIVTSGLELIVTDSQNKQKLVNIVKLIERNIIIINYDDIQQLLFQDYSHLTTIDPSFDKNRICYLLFTSGSTGIPKGVPISNANLCSFLSNANRCFLIDENDILSQTFDLSFDLSMFDIFMSWLNGATLCVMSSLELLNPTDYIIRNKITLWFSVPSLIANVKALKKYNNLYSLRLSLFCGEALYLNDILFWQSIAPKSLIKNLYGPTEATIACSSYKWNNKSKQECSEGIISIGKIFKNLKYIILKEDYKTEASIGELGELCLAGPQIFKGYIGTTQNPFIDFQGISYYKTGDLVYKTENQNIMYVTRRDNQVKIGGHRVELGEIESVIKSIPNVIQVAVLLSENQINHESRTPVAFVKGENIKSQQIIDILKSKLPQYMVPKNIYIIDIMPLNSNGKIDKIELKRMLEQINNHKEAEYA